MPWEEKEKRNKYVGVEATTNYYDSLQSRLPYYKLEKCCDPDPIPGSLAFLLKERAQLTEIEIAYHKDPSALTYDLIAEELRLYCYDHFLRHPGEPRPFPEGVLEFIFKKFQDSPSEDVGKLMVNIIKTSDFNYRNVGRLKSVRQSELKILVPKGLHQLQLQGRHMDLDWCLQYALRRPTDDEYADYQEEINQSSKLTCPPNWYGGSLDEYRDELWEHWDDPPTFEFMDFFSQQLAPYIESLHRYIEVPNLYPEIWPGTHHLLLGGNLRSFILCNRELGPDQIRSVLQTVWQSNTIKEFYFQLPDDGLWYEDQDGATALMTEILQWEQNPSSAIQAFGIDFGPSSISIDAVQALVSMVAKIPKLEHLELAFYGSVFGGLGALAELIAHSQTLTSLKIFAEPHERNRFFSYMKNAIISSQSLTQISIKDNGDYDCEPYDSATESFRQMLSILENAPNLQQWTVEGYSFTVTNEQKKEILYGDFHPLMTNEQNEEIFYGNFHPLMLNIELLCAQRRCRNHLPANLNDTTKEDIYESVVTARTDGLVCPQKVLQSKKLAIITSALYDNVRNNNDAWVSIMPSLAPAPGPAFNKKKGSVSDL